MEVVDDEEEEEFWSLSFAVDTSPPPPLPSILTRYNNDLSENEVRIGEIKRVTKETNVSVRINLDGTGVSYSTTGI
ncbi:imidazoleglycerol-phosphate dehydratase 2, chloroplastic-like [Mercurialis annua]|uniref:imidazoleglycerol-phosphate dehydratase 2, chloroplastic-like n=1 Tax=Mercurialis annua TaxID=3986 RepID=UPI00215F9414|nr:imidazoleglycerol-phosphate dehydratase 2, chloroplastic-like [Mercurialis annua]